jgi:NAD(P)-dependent dehydrogenase (short-subunit alcohol dehydrogenase family)
LKQRPNAAEGNDAGNAWQRTADNPMSKENPFSVAGRVALVTGSSKGLGRAMAMSLGKAGAKVAINYLNDKSAAEKTFTDFKAAGGAGGLFRADVTKEEDVVRLHAEIVRELGPVDILVVNATCDQPHKPMTNTTGRSTRRCLISLSRARFCSPARVCRT